MKTRKKTRAITYLDKDLNENLESRSEEGFSLVTVLSVGLVGTLLITAMFASVLPTLRGVTKSKTDAALREGAESALDFVVARIAAGDANYQPSTKGGSVTVSLPSSSTSGSPLGSFAGVTVNAQATIEDVACPNNSYLYTFTLDPASNASQIFGQNNRWRVVTATANIGGNTNATRTLRAVMKPIYNSVTSTVNVTTTTTTNNSGWPFSSIAASGNFVANGGIVTNTYDSATDPNATSFINQYAHVGANGNASTNAKSGSIGGNFVAAGTASPGNTTIHGTVTSNAAPMTFPPVPPHPNNASPLSPISNKNNQTYVLSGGDYYISANNAAALNIQGTLSISGTVRIWVEGTSPTIDIKGLSNTGNPANFQIFYNPTNPVATASQTNIAIGGNGNFRGVVYAPNTDLSVSGASNYYGSLVGNDVTLNGGGNGGGFHYDLALNNTQLLQWTTTTTTTTPTTTTSQQFAQSKCVSWEEL